MTSGYRALRESAAWLDLSGRGKVLASGEDRARLLHAMTTNQVEGLAEASGCYAFFLNAQGRILGDVNLFRMPDHFLLDTEPETAGKLREHLDRYIIADDVTLEDVTAGTATIAVEGPRAAELLAALGAPVPDAAYGHLAWEDRTVARVDSTGAGGCFLFLPAGGKTEADSRARGGRDHRRRRRRRPRRSPRARQAALRGRHHGGSCPAGNAGAAGSAFQQGLLHRPGNRRADTFPRPRKPAARAIGDRCGAGRPRDGAALPGGAITSAAYSPALGKVVALGYVRADAARPGTEFLVDGAPASVVAFDSVPH